MVRIGNDLEIPVQEIGEILGRRTRRTARVAAAFSILAARTFHSTRPYPFLAGLVGLGLGIAPFFIEASAQTKTAMQAGSLPLSLLAAQGLIKQAKDDEEEEDDREFFRNLNREAYRETQAMELESGYLALREQNYSALPLHARPDRYDFSEFDKGKQSAGQTFMQNAEQALKQAFSDLPEDEGTQPALLPAAATAATVKGTRAFRELDLAAAAAKNDKSLLVSGVSGVGKTRFLQHAIHAIDEEYEGSQVFLGVDFKGSKEHFCGLERSQSFVTSPAPGRDYQFAAAQINDVVEMLGSRNDDFPLYLFVDEINNGLLQAKAQPSERGERKAEDVLRSNLGFIATQGRERLIRGVFTAHGNLMGMLGIDGDTAQSLVCAVLGRKVNKGDGFALVDKVLKNQVLFAKDESQRLRVEFNQIKAIVEPTGQAIALTNIDGDWEFVLLPTWYKNDPGRINWEPQNQSITQLIASVESDVEPQVEAEVEPKPVPAPEEAIDVPETLKPFLEWAVDLTPDAEGWVSISAAFASLSEPLAQAYSNLISFAKFLGNLKRLDVVDIKSGFEGFKLTEQTLTKLTGNIEPDEAIEFDSDVYSRLQHWMTGTGSKYFDNGVIDIRIICQSFKFKGLRLDSPTVKFYLYQLVEDGLGEWVLTDTQKFRLHFLSDLKN